MIFMASCSGAYGDTLIRVGAEFTQNQKFTIEELKKGRAREPRLEQFLSDIERNPICRRLQLQGILPVEHQRLGQARFSYFL